MVTFLYFSPSDVEHGLHDGICVKVNIHCNAVILVDTLISSNVSIRSKRLPSLRPSFYNTKSVVLCLGITALVCLSVTIFSFQSKVRWAASSAFKPPNYTYAFGLLIWSKRLPLLSQIDVTSCQGVLFSLCMVMLLCAITLSIVVPFGYVSSPPAHRHLLKHTLLGRVQNSWD